MIGSGAAVGGAGAVSQGSSGGMSVIPDVGSLASGVGNLMSVGMNYEQNEWARDLAAEQFRFNKAVQQINWAREDNAVQRRVKDLEAAGMNKVLAAGQSAQSGPVVHAGSVPSLNKYGLPPMSFNPVRDIFDNMLKKATIDRTQAENALIGAQKDKTYAEKDLIKQNEREAKRRAEVSEESGVPSGTGVVGNVLRSIFGASGGNILQKDVRPRIEKKFDQYKMKKKWPSAGDKNFQRSW